MPKGLRPVTIVVDEEPAPPWLSRAWPAIVMSIVILAGLFLSALVSPAPALPPAPTPAPWPGPAFTQAPADHTPSSRRALLIALPGARPDYLHTYITDGTMRNLALLAAGGVVPEYVMPVEPVVTKLNLESLVRGSRPRLAGISDGGIFPAIFPAPPIWSWDEQGKDARDAVLFWPGAETGSAGGNLFINLTEALDAEKPSAVPRIRTMPAGLASAITTAVGAPPTPPPSPTSADNLREYIYRRLGWQTRTAVWLWSNHSPRSMVIAFDALARLAEAGLLSGEDVYDAPTRAAYRRLDQALGALFSIVDMGQTVAVVGTTNGLLAYQRMLNLEAVLGTGLPDMPAEGYDIAAAGGTAFISLRLPAGSPPAVQDAVAHGTLDALEKAVIGGQPALVHTAAGEAARQMGWEDAGDTDFWVQAAPGVTLRAGGPSGENRLWWEEAGFADGYSAEQPEMRGFAVLAGPGITPYGLVGPISLLDIAPTIGVLLHLSIPDSVQGRPLTELLAGN